MTGSEKHPELHEKYAALTRILKSYSSVLIAFSGGVDSSFLSWSALQALGPKYVLAVTSRSPSLPSWEPAFIEKFTSAHGIPHRWVMSREMENERYRENTSERCFFCKSELYREIFPIAEKEGFRAVCNGSNQDDLGDWRPGLKAAAQYDVKQPFIEAGMNKQDIRALAQFFGLEVWDKPAAPCLASRLPYGEHVNREKLERVDRSEAYLRSLGMKVFRVRHYKDFAKLEFGEEEAERVRRDPFLLQKIERALKPFGFTRVEVDADGFRSGKMNDALLPAHHPLSQGA